ncbi:hypothetical protein D3C84_1041550 [compost metagenome]
MTEMPDQKDEVGASVGWVELAIPINSVRMGIVPLHPSYGDYVALLQQKGDTAERGQI